MEELGLLINKIQIEYDRIVELCKNSKKNDGYNLSKTLVKQYNSSALLDRIFEYISFLNDNIISGFVLAIDNWDKNNSKVSFRVKTRNSITYKINNYITNHDQGKIPVNKCINDLFGIRIILDGDYNYNEIRDFVNKNYPDLKCICSDKMDYIATHIYFKRKGDNTAFRWELQVWLLKNEQKNIESHRKYKQGYVDWEKEIKEGIQ